MSALPPLAVQPSPSLDIYTAQALLEGMGPAVPPHVSHVSPLTLTLRLFRAATGHWVAAGFGEPQVAVQAARQVLALLGTPDDQGNFSTEGHGYGWTGQGWRLELVITGNPVTHDLGTHYRLHRLHIALDLRSARASRVRGTLSRDEQLILRRDNSAWPNPDRASAVRRELKRTEANIARAERLRDADPANTDFYVQAQRRAAGELAGLLSRARH